MSNRVTGGLVLFTLAGFLTLYSDLRRVGAGYVVPGSQQTEGEKNTILPLDDAPPRVELFSFKMKKNPIKVTNLGGVLFKTDGSGAFMDEFINKTGKTFT